jgi:hypothetical protein
MTKTIVSIIVAVLALAGIAAAAYYFITRHLACKCCKDKDYDDYLEAYDDDDDTDLDGIDPLTESDISE